MVDATIRMQRWMLRNTATFKDLIAGSICWLLGVHFTRVVVSLRSSKKLATRRCTQLAIQDAYRFALGEWPSGAYTSVMMRGTLIISMCSSYIIEAPLVEASVPRRGIVPKDSFMLLLIAENASSVLCKSRQRRSFVTTTTYINRSGGSQLASTMGRCCSSLQLQFKKHHSTGATPLDLVQINATPTPGVTVGEFVVSGESSNLSARRNINTRFSKVATSIQRQKNGWGNEKYSIG